MSDHPDNEAVDVDTWESAPWEPQPTSERRERERDPKAALLRTEAALVAARNEITLLRARVERLTGDNEQLTAALAAARQGERP